MANDGLAMNVVFVYDHFDGFVFGAPDAYAGEELVVPFNVGARLVAAGFAVPPVEEVVEPVVEDEPEPVDE